MSALQDQLRAAPDANKPAVNENFSPEPSRSRAMFPLVPVRYTRTRQRNKTVLVLQGELDAISAPALRAEVEALVHEHHRQVVVDISGVELIDSSGVALLVAILKRVRAAGGALELHGLRDQPRAIFELLGLDRIFPERG